MSQAQMPEPVPDVEHQPVEEPPDSTPPIEDPPPGEPVPASPIPDRLSASRVVPNTYEAAAVRFQALKITFHRWPEMRSWLVRAGLATALLAWSGSGGHSQAPPVPAIPPDARTPVPAEITPSHPANGQPAPGSPGPDVQRPPQTEIPAPLPPGVRPDTPGGTTSNGVARPPSPVDPGINRGAPAPGLFPTPVIPPPGTPGGDPTVMPK